MDIKEILVMHHSHLDVGYTHTQPIIWEMQREFIDHALEMLEETKDYPIEARPKWTIEVTAQILKWLETASPEKKEIMKKFISEGRIGISGMEYNTTPLCNPEQLIKQLEPIKNLRQEFDVDIKTVNQHDVTGIPWTAVDIFADAGIELLIMAVNIHLGGPLENRPNIFRWKGPSGKEIYVMNGNHYTMFDQLLYTWENSVDRMKEGLDIYLEHLKTKEYKEDFLYLTTAAAPVCWDNSPPSTDVAKLIDEWNNKFKTPLIRYITPNELLKKIKEKPLEEYPVFEGDWTDYWNFGAASTPLETKVNIETKGKIYTAEYLEAFGNKKDNHFERLNKIVWDNLNLFDEHTWGSFNSLQRDLIYTKTQANIKDNYAYVGNETAEYLLIDQLENVTNNPKDCESQDGIYVINPTDTERTEYIGIPDWWKMEGKRLRTSRFGWQTRYEQPQSAPKYGPVKLLPFEEKYIPFENLPECKLNTRVSEGEIAKESEGRHLNVLEIKTEKEVIKFIESEWYKIEFDPKNCRILSLIDKKRDENILDENSDYTFFQYVRERTDPLHNNNRRAYYARKLEKEQFDISCWNTDWKKKIETAEQPLGYKIDKVAEGIRLTLKFSAPGVKSLEQEITLLGDSPMISLKAKIDKEDIETPESIYFAFPIKLKSNWNACFDTAGVPTLLDNEQLHGSSKDWITSEAFVSVYDEDKGITLFTSEAPMAQIGDFNFGKRSENIKRDENPLLLAWPMNNYWDTNFRSSQPGFVEIKYFLTTFENYNPDSTKKIADSLKIPVQTHPAMFFDKAISKQRISINGTAPHIFSVKKDLLSGDVLIKYISYAKGNSTFSITFPENIILEGYKEDSFGNNKEKQVVSNNNMTIGTYYRELAVIRVKLD